MEQIFRLLHEKVQAERAKTPKTINKHALFLKILESTDESQFKKLRFKKESLFKKDCSYNQTFSS